MSTTFDRVGLGQYLHNMRRLLFPRKPLQQPHLPTLYLDWLLVLVLDEKIFKKAIGSQKGNNFIQLNVFVYTFQSLYVIRKH